MGRNDLSLQCCKPVGLPFCLAQDQGCRERHVDRAQAGPHGNAQRQVRCRGHRVRHAGTFAPDHDDVVFRKAGSIGRGGTLGGQQHQSPPGIAPPLLELAPAVVLLDGGVVEIVQPGAGEGFGREGKAGGMDDMDGRAQAGTQPDQRAGIVGDVVNSAAYTEYYPIVAGAHGLYSYVNAGGGNAGDQIITTQGAIEGDINISGKITLEKPEFTLEMLQPGAVPGGSSSGASPLFNRKLGVMTLGERPSAYYYDKRHSCSYKEGSFLGGTWTCQTTRYTKLIHTPNILLNNEIDTPLSSLEAKWGWVPNDSNSLIDYKALDENVQDFVITRELGSCSILFSSPGIDPENPNEGCLAADFIPFITPPHIAAKATLELEEADNDSSIIPVTLYRQYQSYHFDTGSKEAFEQIGHFNSARVHGALDLASGNSSTGQFATGGYTDFFAQSEIVSQGDSAMQAPPLPDGRISRLETYIDATYGGTLYFNWKVSSQAGADKLKILINGEEAKAISGEQDWHQSSVNLPPGRHHVIWEYSKDASLRAGKDTGWVDKVHFMTDPEINFTADSYQVTPGSSINLSWTSKDSGFCVASGDWSGFKDPNGQENTGPVYSPKNYVLECTNWLLPDNISQKSTRVVSITLQG